MRLLQITASDVWRGHEQKIIYLYEAFQEKNYVEDQYIVCPNNTPIYDIAKEHGAYVFGTGIEQSEKKFYNTLVAANPSGKIIEILYFS